MSNKQFKLAKSFYKKLAIASILLILSTIFGSLKAVAAEDYVCGKNGLNPVQFIHAQTRNFNIYICGDEDNPNQYVRVSKKDGKKLVLPLIEQSPSGIALAVNTGGYLYQLTRESLMVFLDGRMIVNEKLTSYRTN